MGGVVVNRVEVLGIPVDCVTMPEAVRVAHGFLRGNQPRTIIAVNPEKIIACEGSPELASEIRSAGLLIPDGIGVVLAARFLGGSRIARVPGCELMPELCRLAAAEGYKVFLFGARPEVNQQTVMHLQRQFPGISIVGAVHGYITAAENEDLVRQINESGADILFLALGSPRQEQWMRNNLPRLGVKICQGVGGTFDVICGNVKRAPAFFRKLHLEWFYRLASQPTRLARQSALPLFAWKVLRQRLRLATGRE